MDWINNTIKLEIDITSNCSIGCISCNRLDPDVVFSDFTQWEELIDSLEFDLQELMLSSTWGDPLGHPKLLAMLDYLLEVHPECELVVSTSLEHGDEDFYEQLAELMLEFRLARLNVSVFGPTTEHKSFRTNGSYDNVKRNTSILTKQGVSVFWNLPMFAFNEHHVETMRKDAEDCGVFRFDTVLYGDAEIYEESERGIEEPPAGVYLPPPSDDFEHSDDDFGNKPFPINTNRNEEYGEEKKCNSFYQRRVYIDSWGYVWPCHQIGYAAFNKALMVGVVAEDAWEDYGVDFNHLSKYTLKEIMAHQWFTNDLPDSHASEPWEICNKECDICGTG